MSTMEEKSRVDTREELGIETSGNGVPKGYFSSTLFLGTMTAIGMGFLSSIAGFGYLAPILATVNSDIGPSDKLPWVSAVFTLSLAVGLTLVGRLSDIFGRRYIFSGGAALGVVGSIVSSTATSINMLIGGMTLIGLAASTQASYFYVTAELVPSKYRFACNAVIYVFGIPGAAFSPSIAYAVIAHTPAGWRTLFYILIGYNASALACWLIFYHPPTFETKHKGSARLDYIKSFDFVGMVLFTGGLLILLMGLIWGGSLHPWKSAYVIATIVTGAVALIVFVLWELFARLKEPLVPFELLRQRGWIAAVCISGINASLYYALAIVWPQMVNNVYPSSSIVSNGLVASIVGLCWNIGEIVSGGSEKLGFLRSQMIVALAGTGIFLAAMASCTPDTKTVACVLLSFSATLGGLVEGLSLTTTTLILPDQQQLGSACGFGGSVRFTIITIVTAIYSVVLSTRLRHTVPAEVIPALVQAKLPMSSVAAFVSALELGSPLESVPGTSSAIIRAGVLAYKHATADAYRTIFYTTIPFTVLGLIAAAILPNIDELINDRVSVLLQRGGGKVLLGHEEKIVESTEQNV